MAVTESGPARQRNPRGQGERLRNDIIEAASKLLADPASPPLTLRAVAREVGVAATSVYLHFNDIQSLVLAVAERRFGELEQMLGRAIGSAATPVERLVGGCLAYCEFGLAHPGHYQVMFVSPLPTMETVPLEQAPAYQVFQQLIDAVAATMTAPPAPGAAPTPAAPPTPAGAPSPSGLTGTPEAFATATLIWQQLHGIVSLRISRPRFPWPPLPAAVTTAVTRLLPST
jgi:AcrR family transcriptional regulator